jgi:NAD(P)-dependent dehydrogenase (short-subunit alcohol dehydrogenase family)
MRSKVLITGAAGGMGRACARLFGSAHELVLTDVAAAPLERFAEELVSDGYVVDAYPGDLADEKLLQGLRSELEGGAPFTFVHTAGIAPSQGDWRSIMTVNLLTTERLLRALEDVLAPGSVGILIASTAGHGATPTSDILAILDDPLASDFFERLTPFVDSMTPRLGPTGARGLAYMLSKHGVLRMAERRAAAWGEKGARIASISPGVIMTPMSRKELVDSPGTAEARDAAALGRAGTPMDIARAAQFLASDAAAFITGTDLRVDGGSIAAQRHSRR